MLGRVLTCAALGLALICQSSFGGGKGKQSKVPEIPKDAIAGEMKSVDLKERVLTLIEKASGKERAFAVDKDTKFIGPRGGISDEGLKDDRLEKGYQVHVVADNSGKAAREVHLPFRKPMPEKKKKK